MFRNYKESAMSKLYKKVKLLVSRGFYHGGEGLEDLGLRIFHSMEEYEVEAGKNGSNNDKSFKSSWYVKPVEIEGWIKQKDFTKFNSGQTLDANKVLFPGSFATQIHKIGR